MALLRGIFGKMAANKAVGATEEIDPVTGKVRYMKDGVDVTKQVKKQGTGPVAKPSLAQRIWSPETAREADVRNIEFQTLAAQEGQKFGIELEQARQIARYALAGASGRRPDEISDDEANAAIGSMGLSIKGGGYSAGQQNEESKNIRARQLGVPGRAAEYESTLLGQGQRRADTYGAQAGPEWQGTQDVAQARTGTQRAGMESRMMPLEERAMQAGLELNTALALGDISRLPVTQGIRDVQAFNQLREAQNIDPLVLDVKEGVAQEQKNVLDLTRRSIVGNAAQNALTSEQVPQSILSEPYIYNIQDPTQLTRSGDLLKAYGKADNPAFMPPLVAKFSAMNKLPQLMGQGQSQGQNGIVQAPDGSTMLAPGMSKGGSMFSPLVPRTIERPAGPINPSTPAPLTITTPAIAPVNGGPRGSFVTDPSQLLNPANILRSPLSRGNVTMDPVAGFERRRRRIEELVNKRTTYTITPAEEAELKALNP